MKNKNDFEFKYVAPTSEERKEIESIRRNYLTQEKSMSKIDYLRKLDAKVKEIPMVVSLIIGVLGTLIFGLGLTMILEWNLLVWGIVICAIMIVPVALAYSIYRKLDRELREKYSEEILRLTDELLNNEKEK